MTPIRPHHRVLRGSLACVLAFIMSATLSGFAPESARSTTGFVAGGSACEFPYQYRQDTVTDVDAEEPYLKRIVVCSIDELGTASIVTNNSDVVWYFIGREPVTIRSAPNSTIFRQTVVAGNLYGFAYMAPGDTMYLPTNTSWAVHPDLTAVWTAQDVYTALLNKHAKSAALWALVRGSKTNAAIVNCGIGFADGVDRRGVTDTSTEKTVLSIFADVGVAGNCATAIKGASSEIGSKELKPLLGAVERAGSLAETGVKLHKAWNFVLKLCAIAPKCG